VKPSGKFGVMVRAANSVHSASVSGSRPLTPRLKNNSATSIHRSASNRQVSDAAGSGNSAQAVSNNRQVSAGIAQILANG